MKRLLATTLLLITPLVAEAQFRPPPFIGGIPGLAQSRAIFLQRHQSRTLLYREALDELRKNPAAADLPSCGTGVEDLCVPRPLPVASTATPTTEKSVDIVTPAAVAVATPAAAVPPAPTSADTTASGRRIALLIGNNEYYLPIPQLETPLTDVAKLAALLESRFGFETRIVKNAGQLAMMKAMNKVAADTKPEDSVLIFYAGHGFLLEDINMGFWIPADASVKTAKGWISNKDIADVLAAIKARQVILVSDSCYSGTLTSGGKIAADSALKPEDILKQRSVSVLSSGGDEPVSDEGKDGHSIFAYNLLKALQDTGSLTPGARVWKTVHTGVTKEYPQTPQYGAVVTAGHIEGGDFLFRPQ